MEHRGGDEGPVRGATAGLVFGSFILLGLEISGEEPEAYLGDPHAGLVFVTTLAGALLGTLGGNSASGASVSWRRRRLRPPAPARSPARGGSSAVRR